MKFKSTNNMKVRSYRMQEEFGPIRNFHKIDVQGRKS